MRYIQVYTFLHLSQIHSELEMVQQGLKMSEIVKKFQTVKMVFQTGSFYQRDCAFFVSLFSSILCSVTLVFTLAMALFRSCGKGSFDAVSNGETLPGAAPYCTDGMHGGRTCVNTRRGRWRTWDTSSTAS